MNIVGMLATPLISGAIDTIGGALNLDPKVTAAAKVAVGAYSLNPTLVLEGATQYASELQQPAARTEYHPACDRHGVPWCPGYAPPTVPLPGGGTGASPLPGDYGKYLTHLKTLQANLSLFDGLVRRDGSIDRDELTRMASNPKADARLREAAQFLLDHPHYFNRLERAAWDAYALPGRIVAQVAPPGMVTGDGRISCLDLGAEIRRVEADLRHYGLPGQGTAPPPAPGTGTPPPASPPPGSGTPPPAGGPAPGSPAPGTGGTDKPKTEKPGGSGSGSSTTRKGSVEQILKDKNLSLEQKIERVLKLLTDRINEQLADAMRDLDEAVDRQGTVKSGDKKGQVKADQEVQEITRRIQDLTQQKQELNHLMSTFSLKHHEMAQVALQNLARA